MVTQGVPEIYKLLKLDGSDESPVHDAPESLPVADHAPAVHSEPVHAPKPLEVPKPLHADIHEGDTTVLKAKHGDLEIVTEKTGRLKGLLIYPVIFAIAFGFFYVVLNFSAITAQVSGFFTKPQAQEVLGADTDAFYKWISNYYYAVNNSKLLDPNNDIDADGLTNHDEFIMHTNPIVADSDQDGYSDGIEVLNSYNPWGIGALTPAQKKLAEVLDMGTISNRIGYNVSKTNGVIAGLNTSNYNLDKAGRLSIPRLNIQVDLIWSKDSESFETDLTKGVIHYPGTALPGEQGTIYISGHSSDYFWKKDPMSNIFSRINYLQPGDDIFLEVYGNDGKTYNYRYGVTGNKIYKPDDQTQFIDNSSHKLNLSTCWPIGTSTNRLVVSAEQKSL